MTTEKFTFYLSPPNTHKEIFFVFYIDVQSD